MRLRCIVLGIALAATSTARADYSPPGIDDLVLASDAIVTGRIVALGQDTFTFEVRSVVAGAPGQRIEVRRFVDWTCAARWAPYATGQEVLLFLDRGDGGIFTIRSAGGEGEMPIERDRVLVHSFYGELAPAGANRYASNPMHGGQIVGVSVPVADVVAAIRRARACFSAQRSGDRYRSVVAVRRTCGDAELSEARRTPIGASLIPAVSRRAEP